MALQTARESSTVNEFIGQFDRRIVGLAQSQDLLLRQNWRGAWMRDLVQAHLEPFGAVTRAQISGPDVFLDTTAVQNVGFAFHELATNASKYGALSNEAGRLVVAWEALDDGRVKLRRARSARAERVLRTRIQSAGRPLGADDTGPATSSGIRTDNCRSECGPT
jgi:two-component sensor histidine kinase